MGQDQPVRSTVLVDLARRSLVPGSDPRSPGRGRRRQLPADLVAAEWRLIAAPSAPPQGGALFLCLLQIGRPSCRESVCQYGVDLGGCRIITKKNKSGWTS